MEKDSTVIFVVKNGSKIKKGITIGASMFAGYVLGKRMVALKTAAMLEHWISEGYIQLVDPDDDDKEMERREWLKMMKDRK